METEQKPIDLHHLARGTGYVVVDSPHDTTNIVGRRGHIYADRGGLVVSMDHVTLGESAKLRKLGRPIMDGDCGELSVWIEKRHFRAACRLIYPRQQTARSAA